jgi:hypothetical protein
MTATTRSFGYPESTRGQMEVYAQRVGSSQAVDIGFVDLGPSIIDVPKPGCWHLTLRR